MTKNNDDPFWIRSYKNHVECEKTTDLKLLDTWKQFDTVDAWRHKRMYDSLLTLIKFYPTAKWLTVGDGRYGTDANYLIRHNIKNVLATSISVDLLKIARAEGFIQDYKVENAEKLSFDNETFEFVLCKESYHHFPRPMIAFYEMLRVSKVALVIIEPNDINLKEIKEAKTLVRSKAKLQLLKDFIKDLFRLKRYNYNAYVSPGYETLGNYIYTVSEREFEKAALGLNLPVIAFKGINDYYTEGVEFEKAEERSPLFESIKKGIAAMDEDCKKYERPHNILVSIIFKVMPGENVLDELKGTGFMVKKLPRNPYT